MIILTVDTGIKQESRPLLEALRILQRAAFPAESVSVLEV